MEIPKDIGDYSTVIQALHRDWKPHTGQVRVGRALFNDNCKEVFVQAGRNWGKTELVGYCLWRWALMNEKSENYYFAPYMKQAREILWASQRLQSFGPREWITNINNTEMRITFMNGSFIKLDGSDNVESYRGIKPHGLTVFDEFKDFRPEFYDAFEPNRVAHQSPIVIIGTPPDRECQFLVIAKDFKDSKTKRFFKEPSSVNPHLDKAWLESQQQQLIARGEEDVWQREYEAEFVPGGVSKIFPMFTRTCVLEHSALLKRIHRDRKKLEYIVVADPAASTVFGVLFGALNPYTKEWFILGELYESEQSEMTVGRIGMKVNSRKIELNERAEWRQVYDEASSWFKAEMYDRFGEFWEPTHKAVHKKDYGLSLIKDIMLNNKILISDRCTNLFWELDNYYKDKNGKIPKENDHLIDCLRYMVHSANYDLMAVKEYKEAEDEDFRGARISDDFEGMDDWGDSTGNELLETE